MVNLWDTPGGRRWAAPLHAAMRRGTCVIVCHPDEHRPDGLIDAVPRWASAERPSLRALPVPAALADGPGGNLELLARAVADHLDLDVLAGDRCDPATISGHEYTDNGVIHIDARSASPAQAEAWAAFAAAAAAGTKDRPAEDRAAVIVHVVATPDRAIPNADTNLRVLWWWGALSALDVTVLVDEAERDATTTATIVEVARWDVDLAERLALRWDGHPKKLDQHLTAPAAACTPELTGELDGPAGPAPGSAQAAWNAGLVDAWAGSRDRHVALLGPGGLARRRWQAQVKVIYPWLEELRADIAATIAELAAQAGIAGQDLEDLVAAELGPLRHRACFEHRLPIPRPVRDVLDRAVRARNALAHLTPIDAVSLNSLARAASTARYTPGPVR